MSFLVCKNCGEVIAEKSKDTDAISTCPICGSENLTYQLVLQDVVSIHENMKGESNKMPGKKKPYSEFQAGEEFSVYRNRFVLKTRKIDRENNIYIEEVVDPKTGEIIHECSEPLTEHYGHGSAKKKKTD